MSANSFGTLFRVTSFGESHGVGLGVVIDGCPAGVEFHEEILRNNLARRRPGSNELVSARQEADVPEILSGVYEGKTLGTPIAMLVRNQDARSQDYQDIAKNPRQGHADDMWLGKFLHSDPRGGGRSSGRETLARVLAGSVAQMFLRAQCPKLSLKAFAQKIGPHEVTDFLALEKLSVPEIDSMPARFPVSAQATNVEALLLKAKTEGKSYGGVAELWVDGIPPFLGQPIFHKLKADLATALMGVGATIGVEFGDGFAATHAEGSEFHRSSQSVYGGMRGGLSSGERLRVRVAFKPTSSVLDVAKKGRHDPCIVPRAIPVLESMVHLVLADHMLWRRLDLLERL